MIADHIVFPVESESIYPYTLDRRHPGGGDALGLSGSRLAIGIVGNFVLGALMTLGIGLYAPCMIMIAATRNSSPT